MQMHKILAEHSGQWLPTSSVLLLYLSSKVYRLQFVTEDLEVDFEIECLQQL